MQSRTMIASAAILPYAQRVRREVWPAAIITFGLVLTVGWVCLLGYGLVKLVQLAV
jgi:hypothetical protein